MIAVTVRRLHDTDRSGWWCLLMLVPIVGLVVLVFLLLPGTPGNNRFDTAVPHVTRPRWWVSTLVDTLLARAADTSVPTKVGTYQSNTEVFPPG